MIEKIYSTTNLLEVTAIKSRFNDKEIRFSINVIDNILSGFAVTEFYVESDVRNTAVHEIKLLQLGDNIDNQSMSDNDIDDKLNHIIEISKKKSNEIEKSIFIDIIIRFRPYFILNFLIFFAYISDYFDIVMISRFFDNKNIYFWGILVFVNLLFASVVTILKKLS